MVRPDTHSLLVQPDETIKATIEDFIANAKQSIYLTIYELADKDIIHSMVTAKTKNSVDVRVIFNCSSFKDCDQPGDPNHVAKQEFTKAGIAWKNADPSFTVTHQKTFTFDEATSVIMTFNLNTNYFVSTRDFGVITKVEDEVKEIVAVFNNDWATPIKPSNPSVLVWSPTNSRERIKSVIASANQSLAVYSEEFNDYDIADAMIAAAKRASGGTVQVITAVLADPDTPSHDGNYKMRQYLNNNGVVARYGDWPINHHKMYIHAKMILADYGTQNAQAFVGSENFSPTSLDKNRELGIVLKQDPDSGLLDRLNSTFSEDWPKCQTDS